MSQEISKIFGIDLGTTYSCIAYVDEYGKPIVVPNYDNNRITPSVVFFDEEKIIVGEEAKNHAALYPDQVVSLIKRNMGNPDYIFEYRGDTYRPEEISSYILKKLVKDAENNLGYEIKNVVITCPAYFGINEREATARAGEIAGLNVKSIINEPTAAAISYGVDQEDEKVVLVYDLGGGTFDITMIEIKPESIKVIVTGGDHHLGGKNWDDALVAYFAEHFAEDTGAEEDILDDPETLNDLLLKAESSKKSLSQRDSTRISITHEGEKSKLELSREKFQEITLALLERTVALTHEMLAEAKKKGFETFDEILLVGGSTRMPMIQERIKEEFNVKVTLFDPDESVAKGAAIYGMKLAINDALINRIAEVVGTEAEEIDLESIDQKTLEEAHQDLADSSMLSLSAIKSSGKKIQNVSSVSFGVIALKQDKSEVLVNLIHKNATVPTEISKPFGTAEDNQENVLIRVMENVSSEERLAVEQGKEIGTLSLDLPPNLPAGSGIDIKFSLTDEGRLDIDAQEVSNGQVVNASIDTSCVISGEELENAKKRSGAMIVE